MPLLLMVKLPIWVFCNIRSRPGGDAITVSVLLCAGAGDAVAVPLAVTVS